MIDEISVSEGKLNAVGLELKSFRNIPAQTEKVHTVDVSENEIKDMRGLEVFGHITTLIVDNNEISDFESFPKMPHLETLWANKNRISDLEVLLVSLNGKVPSLTYLSLLGNPVCKNELVGSTKEEAQRYRLYLIHKIPTLKFLDATPVTDEERKQAKEKGGFMAPAAKASQGEVTLAENTFYKDTPNREGQHATFLGYQKNQYTGKTSEGNRFIKDDVL
eukprot:TRINITY_DN11143_c1_g1_i1.p1 TRINITY_DN11143_c1_g1~~TRINITY_DN11143_c1_g1_i1.p1  ORF type:complete len:231 (+),score=76.11 TRINITY_DN11143_c1_g1_i1:36-695(+)